MGSRAVLDWCTYLVCNKLIKTLQQSQTIAEMKQNLHLGHYKHSDFLGHFFVKDGKVQEDVLSFENIKSFMPINVGAREEVRENGTE